MGHRQGSDGGQPPGIGVVVVWEELLRALGQVDES